MICVGGDSGGLHACWHALVWCVGGWWWCCHCLLLLMALTESMDFWRSPQQSTGDLITGLHGVHEFCKVHVDSWNNGRSRNAVLMDSAWTPHRVLRKSPWCPCGVHGNVWVSVKSSYIWTSSGFYGVWRDSSGVCSERYTGTGPHGLHSNLWLNVTTSEKVPKFLAPNRDQVSILIILCQQIWYQPGKRPNVHFGFLLTTAVFP